MDAAEVDELLAEHPDLEEALRAVRDVDSDRETWGFEDVPVDSGRFGELAGTDVVESVDDDYRLAAPAAVDRALAGEVDGSTAPSDGRGLATDVSLPSVDRTAALALAGLLVLTALFRASVYESVFRDRVVYGGNDPYFYVYHVERVLDTGGWAVAELTAPLANGEPLTLLVMVAAARVGALFGHAHAALAWLPVLAGVLTALVLYLFARDLTGDRRIALAAVLCLAVVPVHALRTSLGFVDHHAFDYVWLVVTAWGMLAVVDLEAVTADRGTFAAVGVLAVGVAGQITAWSNGPLLTLPIAVFAVAAGAVAVRDDASFVPTGLGTAVGVATGGLLVAAANLAFGWHGPLTVATPFALAAGVLGVTAATLAWNRRGYPAWTFPASGLAVVAIAAIAIRVAAPDVWTRVLGQFERLFATEGIVEAGSLFGSTSMGWLFLYGLALFFGIPAMLWGAYRGYRGDRSWLLAASYAWFFLVLAAVQSRFAGELAPFVSLFAGVALVFVAERVDAAQSPVPRSTLADGLTRPSRDVAVRLAVVVLLVCGLSAVIAPLSVGQIAIEDERYETAAFIDDHAAEQGYDYPESYVFSPWTYSRMYNYHVSGESRGYGHAQANYREFTLAENPETALQYLRRGTNGEYVVTEPVGVESRPELMQTRLHNHLGSHSADAPGLAHYRVVYVSDSLAFKVFRVVPGATLRGQADPGSTVTANVSVDVTGADRTFTYERVATATGNGTFAVTVPHPGEYRLDGATAESVTVSESAVRTGANVTVDAES